MTVLLLSLCIGVLYYDLLFRRVPNSLLLFFLGLDLVCLSVTGHGIGGMDWPQSIIGGIIGLFLFVPLYVLRAMGAGDVKFFAVLGGLLGPQYLIPLWLIGSLLAGAHAGAIYLSRQGMIYLSPGLYRVIEKMQGSALYRRMCHERQGRQGIPYAAYLAIAAILTMAYWSR
ncbi:MAG TPA: prepilin peptidase [Herbaspirillum sp.]|nr:prepilin peptidase [Herbaspirillum sp.]